VRLPPGEVGGRLGASPSHRPPQRMNEILVVEDTESDAQLLQRALERAGIRNRVHWVSSGEEALAYLAKVTGRGAEVGPPCIAFVDLKLSGLSGFQVLEEMQRQPALSKTLRLAISTLEDIHSIKLAYASGAHSFLTKPATEMEIRAVIHSFPGYLALSGADGATAQAVSPLAW